VDVVSRAAEVYREAVMRGDAKPVVAVASALFVSRATAHRRLNDARALGLLPNVVPGRNNTVAEHQPRQARWTSDGETWLACRTCKTPWPCAEAVDEE